MDTAALLKDKIVLTVDDEVALSATAPVDEHGHAPPRESRFDRLPDAVLYGKEETRSLHLNVEEAMVDRPHVDPDPALAVGPLRAAVARHAPEQGRSSLRESVG